MFRFLLHNLIYVDITSDGQKCIDDCAFRGYSYAWCNTRESWGYCTPASFLAFLSRLHSNGPGIQQPQVLANITFDNLDRDRLLVEDKDANIIDSPSVASTTTSTTPLPSTVQSNVGVCSIPKAWILCDTNSNSDPAWRTCPHTCHRKA